MTVEMLQVPERARQHWGWCHLPLPIPRGGCAKIMDVSMHKCCLSPPQNCTDRQPGGTFEPTARQRHVTSPERSTSCMPRGLQVTFRSHLNRMEEVLNAAHREKNDVESLTRQLEAGRTRAALDLQVGLRDRSQMAHGAGKT